MSSGLFWLALIVIVPAIGLYLLRVNAAAVFLALCLGYVLVSFDSHNAHRLTNALAHNNIPVHLQLSSVAINLGLLLAPAALTLLLQIKSVNGRRKFLNILPSVAVGLFAALIVVPQLPGSVMESVISTKYWAQLTHYETDIVGIGAVISLLFYWFSLAHRELKQFRHHG